ncbi:MAG: hypothetical protein WC303_01950 [Candidatus Paceibacterota bacterium]|jgi:hypothetical protein
MNLEKPNFENIENNKQDTSDELEVAEGKNNLTPDQAKDLEDLFELKEESVSEKQADVKFSAPEQLKNLNESSQNIRENKPTDENIAKLGTSVRVLRSSGSMENGWIAGGINPQTKNVRVHKDGLFKDVSLEDLKKWNIDKLD